MLDMPFKISNQLKQPLPGEEAQFLMAPQPVNGNRPIVKASKSSRRSAVLALLILSSNQKSAKLLFTVRNRNLDHHAGQISFPGGMIEPGETEVEAALREAHEEVGLENKDVHILGKLSDLYVSPSDNIITPIVGITQTLPTFSLQYEEVDEAFTVDIAYLLDKNNIKKECWNLRGYDLEVPFWDIHDVPLWGATAMICSELLEVITRSYR